MTFLMVLFGISYVNTIVRAALKWVEVRMMLNKLTDFCAVFSFGEYANELKHLMRIAPKINEIARYPELSYRDSDIITFEKADNIRQEIQMEHNRSRIAFFRALNPLRSARDVLVLPVSVVQSFGFLPKKVSAAIITIVGDASLYLLDMYKTEIKELISVVIERF